MCSAPDDRQVHGGSRDTKADRIGEVDARQIVIAIEGKITGVLANEEMSIANRNVQYVSAEFGKVTVINENTFLLSHFKGTTDFHEFADAKQYSASYAKSHILCQTIAKGWNDQACRRYGCPVDPLV